MKKSFFCIFDETHIDGDYIYRVKPDDTAVITGYKGSGGELTIPGILGGKSVTEIGEEAFFGCDSLTTVNIPDGVTRIGNRAFAGCEHLKTLSLPASVGDMGINPFARCSRLKTINVPPESKYLAVTDGMLFSVRDKRLVAYLAEAGRQCTVPEGTEVIGASAFSHCGGLTKVSLPESVKRIGGYAFSYCESLTSVNLPAGLEKIGSCAFNVCKSLTSMSIPGSVTKIGCYAVYACFRVTLTVARDSYVERYFRADGWVDSKADGGGDACVSLVQGDKDTIELGFDPDVIRSVFGVREVGSDAVGKDEGLELVPYIFYNECTDGDYTYIKPHDTAVVTGYKGSGGELTVPGILGGKSVKELGKRAFLCCGSLRTVNIPDGVTVIGDYAFSGCDKLRTVSIPDSMTVIGDGAFSGCGSLATVSIPDGVTRIGNRAFAGCECLTELSLPVSVKDMGINPFARCSRLKTINVSPESKYLAVTDGMLFSVQDKRLVAYLAGSGSQCTVPEGTEEIGASAFSHCGGLTKVSLPESVKRIDGYAFSYCKSLTSVNLPAGLENIGSCAFNECNSLTSMSIPGSVTKIGCDAFNTCDRVTLTVASDSYAERYFRADGWVDSKADCGRDACVSLVQDAEKTLRLGFDPDSELLPYLNPGLLS